MKLWQIRMAVQRWLARFSPPIVVYQMGKVGSSSVYGSLRKHGVHNAYQVHRLDPENIRGVRQEYLRKELPPPDEPGIALFRRVRRCGADVRMISLVRDPVARNMSAFFENFQRFAGSEYADSKLDIAELGRRFLEEYDHDVPLTWFDLELKSVTGIDVFGVPFPKAEGHMTYRQDKYHLLLMKCELDMGLQEQLIRDFLGLQEFRLSKSNVGSDKGYSATYKAFLKDFSLPMEYLERMYTSKYAAHFYTPEELDAFRNKWTRE